MRKAIALMIVATGLAAGAASAKETPALFDTLSRRASVKGYVETFADAVKPTDLKVDTTALKGKIEKALTGRKSIKFEVVNDKSQADIAIEGKILEVGWQDTDPVDMIVGLGGVAMDAAMSEHYCVLVSEVTVNDVKAGACLYKDNVRATVTTNDMKKETFGDFIYDDFAKVLMKEAFGKKKS